MKTVIVDGNNLAMRCFHAAHGSMTSGGHETGSLQLFITALSKHVREERPGRLVVCWDQGDSTKRLALYPQYKAARRAKQALGNGDPHRELFALIHKFLSLSNISQWAAQGVEADDLIASGWLRHSTTDKVVILSADKDLLQLLLDYETEVVRFATGGAERCTRAQFIEERTYRPEQLPLMMALMGDTSDGVPGMRGIGPKKALKLLVEADWDLDQVMRSYPEQRDLVMTCQKLVDLMHEPVPVPEIPEFRPVINNQFGSWESLLEFCDRWELRTIRQRLVGADLWA